MAKVKTIIIGWSVGMIGLTMAGFGMYFNNPLLSWIGSSITIIGLIILNIKWH